MNTNQLTHLLRPVTAAVAVLAASFAAWAQPSAPREWAPGRLIVMQRAGLPQEDLDKLVRSHGAKSRRMGKSDLHVMTLPAGVSEVSVLARLEKHPHLKFAELDYKVTPHLAVNDPYIGSQWALPFINMPAAWDVSQGSGVVIAVLDSGVLGTHADLLPNLVPGWNAVDGNTITADVLGHGTSVAGTAAAVSNNATGTAGIAGRASIMPIRITNATGAAYYSAIASGIIYAADHGARVANCSWGPLFNNSSVQSAGNYLKSKGGLLVVSAGNNAINENAAATAAMITVSATTSTDTLASWSSYGSMVSVSAPGVGIWTTSSAGGYTSVNGTSFASPIVAGVVALMMSANPALSAAQVEGLLYSTAVDLGAAGRDIYFGHGRVNADAAVRAAVNTVAKDSVAPAVLIASPAGGAVVSGIVSVDVQATDNVGVARVELRANGTLVGTDTVAPYQFSWASTGMANGGITLTATAFDAAGNSKTSAGVLLTASNAVIADTQPPTVKINNPAAGAKVSGTLQVSTSAADNAGPATLRQTLYIDGAQVATATGGSLNYSWNTRKASLGGHTISVVASDAAGNKTTTAVSVTRVK